MKPRPRTLIATLPALILRLWLTIYPERLWYDEAFSVLVARLSGTRLLEATAGDVHPPLYYMVLRTWLSVFPAQRIETAARFLSFFLSILALGLFWAWLSRLELPQGRKEAAFLLAAYMPGATFYAAEARMYSLLSVCVMGALYALWYEPKRLAGWINWPLLGGCCLGWAALTHNIGMVYAAVIMVAYWVDQRERRHTPQPALWATSLIAVGAAVIIYTPWVERVFEQTTSVTSGYWTWLPKASSVAYALLRAMVPAGPQAWPWEQLVFVLLGGVTTWAVIAGYKQRTALILALGVPVLSVVLSYTLNTGLLLHRTLVPALPFVALLWTELLAREDVGKPLAVVLAVALLAVNVGYVMTGRHAETWHELAYIEPQPGDVVYSIGAISIPMALYGPDDVPVYVLPAEGKPPGTGLSAQTLGALGVWQKPLEEVDWTRAWVFYYEALPGMVQEDVDYFASLRERYAGQEIAPYSEALGGNDVVKGGLWLLKKPQASTAR